MPGSTLNMLKPRPATIPAPPGASRPGTARPDVLTDVGDVVGDGVESVAKVVGNLIGPVPAYNGPCVRPHCTHEHRPHACTHTTYATHPTHAPRTKD